MCVGRCIIALIQPARAPEFILGPPRFATQVVFDRPARWIELKKNLTLRKTLHILSRYNVAVQHSDYSVYTSTVPLQNVPKPLRLPT